MKQSLNKTTRVIIGGTLAIVIWLTGVFIGQEQAVVILNPEGALGNIITRVKSIQVSLMLDYGSGQVKVYPEVKLTYGATVLDLLQRIKTIDQPLNITYNYNQDKKSVTNLIINHYASNTAGKKWQFWLNNLLITRDISQARLKTGDIVEFKYIKLVE